MKLGDFHCRSADLVFGISADKVNKGALLEAAGTFDSDDETDDTPSDSSDLAVVFSSRDNPEDHHSHIYIEFKPDDVQVQISFYDSKGEADPKGKPPYMEDCVKWLGEYIEKETVTMGITVVYTFEKNVAPIISVRYPVLSNAKVLAGSIVTGVAIKFPKEALLDYALIQTDEDRFGLSLHSHDEITLKEFDIYEELKKFEPAVAALTQKVERSDEKTGGK